MAMGDRSEGQMTALVDAVCEKAVGENWPHLDPWKKYSVKQTALPVITAAVEVIDAEPHRAKRDDEVAAWIKRCRDGYAPGKRTPEGAAIYQTLDMLLDDYRLHADTGTPLSEDAPEH